MCVFSPLISHVDGIPQKPPNSGYAIFSKKLFAGNALKDFEGKALLPEVSRRWKELSDAERAVYTQEATKVHSCYNLMSFQKIDSDSNIYFCFPYSSAE